MIELQMIDVKMANTEKSEEERGLLREIWRLLGGENTDEQIVGKSIRNFICIILNFDKQFLYFPDLDTIDQRYFDDNIVGIISRDGIFYIKDKKEIKKIHKSFNIFCLNRFNNLSTVKNVRYRSVPHRDGDPELKFYPEINKKSKMIDKKRSSSRTPRHDLLLKAGAVYNQNKSRRSIENLSNSINGCTFKPHLETSKHQNTSSIIENPPKRSEPTKPQLAKLLLDSTKRRIDEIEQDLKIVDTGHHDDFGGVTPIKDTSNDRYILSLFIYHSDTFLLTMMSQKLRRSAQTSMRATQTL